MVIASREIYFGNATGKHAEPTRASSYPRNAHSMRTSRQGREYRHISFISVYASFHDLDHSSVAHELTVYRYVSILTPVLPRAVDYYCSVLWCIAENNTLYFYKFITRHIVRHSPFMDPRAG
jgi:hypothetical protein